MNVRDIIKRAEEKVLDITENAELGFTCPECENQISFFLKTGEKKKVTCSKCKTNYIVIRFKDNLFVQKEAK